jgi:hypothetical protein
MSKEESFDAQAQAAEAPVDIAPTKGDDVGDEHDRDIDNQPVGGPVDPLDLPRGWKYKQFRVFGVPLWYASPRVQLLMVSFVCFMCPGMFNALGGLGGGGKINPTLADNMVSAPRTQKMKLFRAVIFICILFIS